MTKILTVIGTRPEIVKCSPLIPLLRAEFQHVLVHTGQHYDYSMDQIFFEELELPRPDYNLAVGSGAQGAQTAAMLARLEPILQQEAPDLVLAQGDTNTTLAGALAACKLGIPVVHLEAGCRSFNRSMPEEINRVLVDHCAALLLAPDEIAGSNLRAEGIPEERIAVVGSTAIDACERNIALAGRSAIRARLEVEGSSYLVLTLHRAENTTPQVLPGLVSAINRLAQRHTIVWPMHPRTRKVIQELGLSPSAQLRICEPLGYLDMLQLLGGATLLLTDSGGLQEEAAVLNVPAAVLRNETEWSYLVKAGKHLLVGSGEERVVDGVEMLLQPEILDHVRQLPNPCRTGAAAQTLALLRAWAAEPVAV